MEKIALNCEFGNASIGRLVVDIPVLKAGVGDPAFVLSGIATYLFDGTVPDHEIPLMTEKSGVTIPEILEAAASVQSTASENFDFEENVLPL